MTERNEDNCLPGSGNAAAADQVGLRKEDEEVPAERCEKKTGEDQQPVGGRLWTTRSV